MRCVFFVAPTLVNGNGKELGGILMDPSTVCSRGASLAILRAKHRAITLIMRAVTIAGEVVLSQVV